MHKAALFLDEVENCRRLLEAVETAEESPEIRFHDISGSRGIEFIEGIRLSEQHNLDY